MRQNPLKVLILNLRFVLIQDQLGRQFPCRSPKVSILNKHFRKSGFEFENAFMISYLQSRVQISCKFNRILNFGSVCPDLFCRYKILIYFRHNNSCYLGIGSSSIMKQT